jgi:hypothetical protein
VVNKLAAVSPQALFLHTVSASKSAVQKLPKVFLRLLQNEIAVAPAYA